jgi:hypothetical protein
MFLLAEKGRFNPTMWSEWLDLGGRLFNSTRSRRQLSAFDLFEALSFDW